MFVESPGRVLKNCGLINGFVVDGGPVLVINSQKSEKKEEEVKKIVKKVTPIPSDTRKSTMVLRAVRQRFNLTESYSERK